VTAANPPQFDTAFRTGLEALFRWRRDVRRFRRDPVPQETVEALVELAALAPSVGFSQPWRFVSVEDAARRAKIRENFLASNREALADYEGERARLYAALKLEGLDEAPVHLAVFADAATPTGHGLGQKTMPETLGFSAVMAVHTLWLPIVPLQIGLVLKPGPQEPWTPYRIAAAFAEAGIPREVVSIYPGEGDVGAAVLDACGRSLIFGGTATVDRYRGNPRVQAHGPGFSKILLGDDQVDRWETYLDVMVESVLLNSGRSCINCSGIWASRHSRDIADAIARRLAEVRPLPPEHPEAALAAFTVPGVAEAISQAIDADLQAPGVTDVTAAYRDGSRVVTQGRAEYLLPTVVHASSPDAAIAGKEYMFPFVSVVECPEARMVESIGPTLVASAITCEPEFRRRLLDATHIDRLNLGPVPTTQLNWLQPHEGNIVEFLFRARAFQTADL